MAIIKDSDPLISLWHFVDYECFSFVNVQGFCMFYGMAKF